MVIAGRTIGLRRAHGAAVATRAMMPGRRREGLFDTIDKITRRPVRVRVCHMLHALRICICAIARFRLVCAGVKRKKERQTRMERVGEKNYVYKRERTFASRRLCVERRCPLIHDSVRDSETQRPPPSAPLKLLPMNDHIAGGRLLVNASPPALPCSVVCVCWGRNGGRGGGGKAWVADWAAMRE